MKFAARVAPRAVVTTGRGTTGKTAYMIKPSYANAVLGQESIFLYVLASVSDS